MIRLTDAQFAALSAGAGVTSRNNRIYTLCDYVPADGAAAAFWWIKPAAGGRRRRLVAGDLAVGHWKVSTATADAAIAAADAASAEPAPAEPAARRMYDYATTSGGKSTHYVEAVDIAPDARPRMHRALCGRMMPIVERSDDDAPGAWHRGGKPHCQSCYDRAKELGMISRRRAGLEQIADAVERAQAADPAEPAEPAVPVVLPDEALPLVAHNHAYSTGDGSVVEPCRNLSTCHASRNMYARRTAHSAAPAAPVQMPVPSELDDLVDFAVSPTGDTRHYVKARPVSIIGDPRPTLCRGRVAARYVIESTADAGRRSPTVMSLPMCRLCIRHKDLQGLTTRAEAAQRRTAALTLGRVDQAGDHAGDQAGDQAVAGVRVGDAVAIAGMPGVWLVTAVAGARHTPGPVVYTEPAALAASRARRLGAHTDDAAYMRAQRVYAGGDEALPLLFLPCDVRPVADAAAGAAPGDMAVWLAAANGPAVAPIAAEHAASTGGPVYAGGASVYVRRVERWQTRAGLPVAADLVVRVGDAWMNGAGKTLPAPAAAACSPAAPGEGETAAGGQAAPAASSSVGTAVDPTPPALPQVADDIPLCRRDLVTYNGSPYVIIRPDSAAELDRGDGQVVVVGPMAGRAFAEHAVEVTRRIEGNAGGAITAELVCRRVDDGAGANPRAWLSAPMRSEAERQEEVRVFLEALAERDADRG